MISDSVSVTCCCFLATANGNSEARAAAIGNLKRRVAKAKPLAAVKGQHKVLHQALAKAGKTIDKVSYAVPHIHTRVRGTYVTHTVPPPDLSRQP